MHSKGCVYIHVNYVLKLHVSIHSQVDDAETVFNQFRRAGHQFDVEVYNKMIFGWAQKVRGNHIYFQK